MRFNLEKLSYYSLFIACFFLPIKTSISNLGILFFILTSIISFFCGGVSSKTYKSPYFYLSSTIALFIPYVLGIFYTPDLEIGFLKLNKSIFFLLIPIFLLRKDLNKTQVLRWSSFGLILGSTLSVIVLLTINFYNFSNSGLPLQKLLSYNYTGNSFIQPLREMHPIYLGSYYLFMLVLVWKSNLQLNKALKFGITLLGIISLIFLNARSILLLGMLLLLIAAFMIFSRRNLLIVISCSLLLVIAAKPIYKDTYVYNKLVRGTLWELSNNVGVNNTDSRITGDSRMSRWLVSLDLIRDNPIFGHGTGSARELLAKEYKVRQMKASLKEEYDSHNQYLGYGIQFGILGLSFLLFFLGSNLYGAIKNRDYIMFSFVIIVGGVCLVENYLARNMGVNFVSLFGAITFYLNRKYD